MRILITAGPTREYLDSVRFLSNGSSGRMGYGCAESALKRGHRVTLVSGPVSLARPKGVRMVSVVSAEEMAEAVLAAFPRCDVVIMTAAVSDYRPVRRLGHKLSKRDVDEPLMAGGKDGRGGRGHEPGGDHGGMEVAFERTRDILAELGAAKAEQKLIGFAVQDRHARRRAREKLREKRLDAIVLNHPSVMGQSRTEADLLVRGGRWQRCGVMTKRQLANRLIRLAESLCH